MFFEGDDLYNKILQLKEYIYHNDYSRPKDHQTFFLWSKQYHVLGMQAGLLAWLYDFYVQYRMHNAILRNNLKQEDKPRKDKFISSIKNSKWNWCILRGKILKKLWCCVGGRVKQVI